MCCRPYSRETKALPGNRPRYPTSETNASHLAEPVVSEICTAGVGDSFVTVLALGLAKEVSQKMH